MLLTPLYQIDSSTTIDGNVEFVHSRSVQLYEGGGAETSWVLQKWPPSLQICRMTSRPRKPSPYLLLRLRVSAILSPRPAFWTPLAVFIFCSRYMAEPTNNENISLYSRLCNNLKNRLIDKLKIFIHSVDPKFFFVKRLHKASVRKRRPSKRL